MEAIRSELQGLGHQQEPVLRGVVCDVTQPEQVARLAQQAKEIMGTVDVWLCNAGERQTWKLRLPCTVYLLVHCKTAASSTDLTRHLAASFCYVTAFVSSWLHKARGDTSPLIKAPLVPVLLCCVPAPYLPCLAVL